MAAKVIMPALGMAQETGKLITWLKKEGDRVVEGEPLMEIETDKATVEIEAAVTGVLASVSVKEGEDIPVGQTMAWILTPGESAPDEAETLTEVKAQAGPESIPVASSASPVAQKMAAEHDIDLSNVRPSGRRIQKADVLAYLEQKEVRREDIRLKPASPKARRLANERGIELANITGSGPNRAVLAADILAVDDGDPILQAQTLGTVWQRMAERVTHSWKSAPHFYLLREVNASSLISWREHLKERTGKRVTFTDLLVKLVAAALRQHPSINNFWENDALILNQAVNIGLAVAVEDGLVVPVIHNADELTISQITDRRQELVDRSQGKKLHLEDLQNGTFTISNLGMFGVDVFNAILNPPQAAILAVGRIADRVVPVAGQPGVQPMMVLSVSYDHRVVDGARGAQFLDTLANFIEEPFRLVE